jgi:hypothetical protein
VGRRVTLAGAAQSSAEPGGSRRHVAVALALALALAPLSCLTCPPTARARAGWVDHRCLGDGDPCVPSRIPRCSRSRDARAAARKPYDAGHRSQPGRIGAAGIPALRWTDAAATVAARP